MADVFDQSPPTSIEASQISQLLSMLSKEHQAQAGQEACDPTWGLLRFLRGYGNNVAEAHAGFLEGVKWKCENGVNDSLRDMLRIRGTEGMTEDEVFKVYSDLSRLPHWDRVGAAYPERFFHGRDSAGNPVVITSHDMIDNVGGLMTVLGKKEYNEFRVARCVNLELMLDALSRKRKRLIKVVYIWDLNGMNRALYQTWQEPIAKAYWEHFDEEASVAFPESALRIVAVNVPTWLHVIWNIVKRVIPARTLKKILVAGGKGLVETLQRDCHIPIENVPRGLGGSCPEHLTQEMFKRPARTWMVSQITIVSGPHPVVFERAVPEGVKECAWSVWMHGRSGRHVSTSVHLLASTEGLGVVHEFRVDGGGFVSGRCATKINNPMTRTLRMEFRYDAPQQSGFLSSWSGPPTTRTADLILSFGNAEPRDSSSSYVYVSHSHGSPRHSTTA